MFVPLAVATPESIFYQPAKLESKDNANNLSKSSTPSSSTPEEWFKRLITPVAKILGTVIIMESYIDFSVKKDARRQPTYKPGLQTFVSC